MKIFIEYDLKNQSGKGFFIQRLTAQWDKMGIKYSDKENGCDARLAVTRFRTKSKLPTLLRIDGSYNEIPSGNVKDKKRLINSMNWKNKKMRENIKKSAGVIWQSEFCRKMGIAMLKIKPRKEFVIFNGASPGEFFPHNPGPNVVMSAHWKNRTHKRLKEMLQIAEAYSADHPDIFFHVLGDYQGKFKKHKNIKFYGRVNQEKMKEVFSISSCMLNICYADWCPNAVVEALVAGVPVICTANHGVSEIVKDTGVIVDIDDPIPTKHFRMAENKPIKSLLPVYKALDKVMIEKVNFPRAEHLYIESVAKQYADAFRSIL